MGVASNLLKSPKGQMVFPWHQSSCQGGEDWDMKALLCAGVCTGQCASILSYSAFTLLWGLLSSIQAGSSQDQMTIWWGHLSGATWLINGQTRFQKKVWLFPLLMASTLFPVLSLLSQPIDWGCIGWSTTPTAEARNHTILTTVWLRKLGSTWRCHKLDHTSHLW